MISAPSGAGKTTIVAGVLRRRSEFLKSISVTTRSARPGEVHGEHYLFVSDAEFDRMRADGELLEWAEVHGARYGTPRGPVDAALAQGRTVILEIDVQGARSIRAAVPDALLIFIQPPSWDVLRDRLTGRGTEDDESVTLRLSNAAAEMAAAPEFDHCVVNDVLEDAVSEVIGIIESGQPRPARADPSHEENPT